MLNEDGEIEEPRVVVNMTERLKRDDVVTELDREEYLLGAIEAYPFLFVDFEIEESYINDLTDGEFKITAPRETHTYARPHECDDCHRNDVHVDRHDLRHDDHHDDYREPIRIVSAPEPVRVISAPEPVRVISAPSRTYEQPRPYVAEARPLGTPIIWGETRSY